MAFRVCDEAVQWRGRQPRVTDLRLHRPEGEVALYRLALRGADAYVDADPKILYIRVTTLFFLSEIFRVLRH